MAIPGNRFLLSAVVCAIALHGAHAEDTSQSSTRVAENFQQHRIYPPYPNVWAWAPRHAPRDWRSDVSLRIIPSGDIVVALSYLPGPSGIAPPSAIVEGFFSHQSFQSVESALGGRFESRDDKNRIQLAPRLFANSISQGINSCNRGASDVLRIEDEAGRIIRARTILVVQRKARVSRSLHCEEHVERGFKYRIAPMRARLLGLADGTFLVADSDSGVVVRLTEMLDSKSPQLGTTVFLAEPGMLNDAINRNLAANDRVVNWGDLQADLMTWVISQRKGEGK